MTKDEALKLALEALEKSVATCFDRYSHEQVMSRPEHFINQAITAIKQARSAPTVQEPEQWGHLKVYGYAPGDYMMTCRGCNTEVIGVDKRASRCKPCANKAAAQPAPVQPEGWKLVPAEPTREMWIAVNKLDDQMAAGNYDGKGCSIEQAWDCLLDAAPTPPAAQPAVPITESEIEKMWFQQADFPTAGQRIVGFARAIEAKLKEKNSD